MTKLILIGAGGHSKSVIDVIENENKWKIDGLIGKNNEIGKKVLGYSVIGNDNELENYRKYYDHAFIAIGQIESSKLREKTAKKLKLLGYMTPNIISSFSLRSKNSFFGTGNFVGHGAIINSSATVRDYCIINSALLEHDVVVNSFCHISTGVLLNGAVEIGEGSFIGSGSIIRGGIKIPPHSVISTGSKIMKWPI